MYQRIYKAYQALSVGDKAELKRCSLSKLPDTPAYFRVLKLSGTKDTKQTQRILFLMTNVRVSEEQDALPVAKALISAGVKEAQIIQITRSGDNSIDYLKRQLVRCKEIALEDLGKLAQYWGDNARRGLLKDFILYSDSSYESKTNEIAQ